jgi:choline kinase/phosphatidylglycerophosphate synthase
MDAVYFPSMSVTAVILAAGRGSRLGARSKPLAIVGGVTLLERAVATARAAGIGRIVVVVDALDGAVASFCRSNVPGVEVAWSPDHARGNGASVLSGLTHAGGRCLIMMVDHLHEPTTLERLLETPGDFVLAVDSLPSRVELGDATLVRHEDGSAVEIAKRLPHFDSVDTGLVVCWADAVVELGAVPGQELEFNELKLAWIEHGHRIETMELDGAFWGDVDTPRDRKQAIAGLLDRYGSKTTDGPVARLINRRLSRLASRCLLGTRIGPNPVTLANLALLVLSGALLALGGQQDAMLILGGVLVQLSSALDGVDGELARVSGRSSELGGVLDALSDRYGDLAVFVGAAIAADTTAAWPWAMAAVVANWQLSFLRREHERIVGSLPASHLRWQWSRDVRLLVLALSCVLLHPLWGLITAAVVGNLDAVRRLIALVRASRRGSAGNR